MKASIQLFVALIALTAIGCDTISDTGPGPVPEARIHIRPAWSTDGQTIAFLDVSRLDSLGLYLVDTTSGANPRPLYIGDAIGFTWSPDNQWVAFSEHGNLYKIRVNGEEKTQLTTIPGSIRPAWSQDGQRIAFVGGTPVATTHVFNLLNNLLEDMQFQGDFPSWHSDSTHLVVLQILRDGISIGGTYNFWLLDPESRETDLMHTFSSPEDCAFSSINSAGTEIVYGAKPLTDYAQVWKVVLSTGAHIELTIGDAGDYPAWSPDGSKIVYTRTKEDDGGLWIMNADGSGKLRLTTP